MAFYLEFNFSYINLYFLLFSILFSFLSSNNYPLSLFQFEKKNNFISKIIRHFIIYYKSFSETLFPGYFSRLNFLFAFCSPAKYNFFRNLRTFFADDIYSRLNDVAKEMNILPEGLTVNSIAGPWTNRDRVPLVTVIRDYESQTLTLSQVCVVRLLITIAY